MTRRITSLLALCVASVPAIADTLITRDGQRYSGTIATIGQGLLSFRTQLAGKVFVPVTEVQAITTSSFVVLTVDGEELLPGHLRTIDGEFFVVPPGTEPPRKVDLAKVSAIDAIRETSADSDETTVFRVETGYRYREGTVDFSGPYVEIGGRGHTGRAEVSGALSGEYVGDKAEFDRFFEAKLRASLESGTPWRPVFELRLSRDRNAALDWRGEALAGLERTLHETEVASADIGVGLGVAAERFDEGSLREDEGYPAAYRRHAESDTESEFNLQLRLSYRRQIFGRLWLEEGFEVLPSVTEFGDIRASAYSSIYFPLGRRFDLKLNVGLDYDNSEDYRDFDDWRTSISAGLRMRF